MASSGQRMSSSTPQMVLTSKGPGVHASSGYAASAALEWPGISISGMMVTWRALAYATTWPDFVLGVEAAIAGAVADVGVEIAADDGLPPAATDLGELRVRLDLDPPALVFGQVPVKGVEFVAARQVDICSIKRPGRNGDPRRGACRGTGSVGASVISTADRAGAPACSSWRKVWRPKKRPASVGEAITTPDAVVVSRYPSCRARSRAASA